MRPMPHAALLWVGLLSSAGLLAQPPRRADLPTGAPAQVTLSDPELDFGIVTPEDPQELPRLAREVTVDSGVPWTFQLLASDLPAADAPAPFPVDAILWRLRGDRFRPLARGLPIILSTGPPTRPGVTTLHLEFTARNDWSIPPGKYVGPLSLVLSSGADGAENPTFFTLTARITLTVAPWATLRVPSPSLESPAVDPARPGWCAFAPLRVGVLSNTAWSLHIEPLDDLVHESAPLRVEAERLAFDTLDGRRERLRRGVSGPVAAGPATGSIERELDLRLSAELAGGEAAGRYRMPFRLRITTGK